MIEDKEEKGAIDFVVEEVYKGFKRDSQTITQRAEKRIWIAVRYICTKFTTRIPLHGFRRYEYG